MNSLLTPAACQIEVQLQRRNSNPLQDYLNDEATRHLQEKGLGPSDYDMFLVRRNQFAGSEVFGPNAWHAGKYNEKTLYGAAGSPIFRFRSAIQALKILADKAKSIDPENVEYGHQATLFWSEVGKLKDFVGLSPVISEIVAEMRTARFQYLEKDTPLPALDAVAEALRLLTEANRLDPELVDVVVSILEEGGIDSLAQEGLREAHGRGIP